MGGIVSNLAIAGLILMLGGVMLMLLGWIYTIGEETEQRMSEAWLWRQREREMRGHWFTVDEDDYVGPDDWTIDIELPPRKDS